MKNPFLVYLTNSARETWTEVPKEWAITERMYDADAIICTVHDFIDFDKLPNAKVVGINSSVLTGLRNYCIDPRRDLGPRVISTALTGAEMEAVSASAEHAWGLLMAIHRRIPHAQVRWPAWDRYSLAAPWQLQGKFLGIVGFGRIGRKLARMALQGFLMPVAYFDPGVRQSTVTKNWGQADITKADSLKELFAHCPAIICSASMMDEPININHFKAARPDAVFVNMSRGENVVTEDLLTALSDGLIRGAAVDVLGNDTKQNPFDVLPNSVVEKIQQLIGAGKLIVTPHIAGSTEDMWKYTQQMVVKRIDKFFGS